MPRRHAAAIRLETLRRSARLAVFALLVFFVRVGVVSACAPDDLAELLSQQSQSAWVASDLTDSGADESAQHAAGHCLHCSCHHAVTLPGAVLAPLAGPAGFTRTALQLRQVSAPPDLSLRPPIL